MPDAVDKPEQQYVVVRNDDGCYSVWPVDRPDAPGWSRVEGTEGPKDSCLAHIADVWTDLRPARLGEPNCSTGIRPSEPPAN